VGTQRRRHGAEFKAKVALEAIKGQRTVSEIAVKYGVHPPQIATWKKEALTRLPEIFATQPSRAEAASEALEAQLYQQIGQLKVEMVWPKEDLALLAVRQARRRRLSARRDEGADCLCRSAPSQVVGGLQVEPELRCGVERLRQQPRGRGSDAALAPNQLVDPLDRHTQVRCERNLRDPVRLQELPLQDDARMGRDAVLRDHRLPLYL
jgi:transposase-like protein